MLAADASGDAAVGLQSPVGEKACATAAPVVVASPDTTATGGSAMIGTIGRRGEVNLPCRARSVVGRVWSTVGTGSVDGRHGFDCHRGEIGVQGRGFVGS